MGLRLSLSLGAANWKSKGGSRARDTFEPKMTLFDGKVHFLMKNRTFPGGCHRKTVAEVENIGVRAERSSIHRWK